VGINSILKRLLICITPNLCSAVRAVSALHPRSDNPVLSYVGLLVFNEGIGHLPAASC
jgi:hypothetical protein